MKDKGLTPEEVRSKRRELLKMKGKKTVVKRGDKRVKSGRICCVCGRPLSVFALTDQSSQSIRDHYSINQGMIVFNLCFNSRSCQYEYQKDVR